MKKLILMTSMVFGTVAWAEGHEPLQLNFNQEIDKGAETATDLTKDISGLVEQKADASEAQPTASEEEMATKKFVDYEIQELGKDASVAGEKPKAVDRRYNSVGEARIAPSPRVTLIKNESRNLIED